MSKPNVADLLVEALHRAGAEPVYPPHRLVRCLEAAASLFL